MNMGKTVLEQRTLIYFCRENGYTDIKFIGVDCVTAVDQTGNVRTLRVSLNGEVLDITSGQVVGK